MSYLVTADCEKLCPVFPSWLGILIALNFTVDVWRDVTDIWLHSESDDCPAIYIGNVAK